jgi:hypothetical protein
VRLSSYLDEQLRATTSIEILLDFHTSNHLDTPRLLLCVERRAAGLTGLSTSPVWAHEGDYFRPSRAVDAFLFFGRPG